MVLEKFFKTYTTQVTSAWLSILILTIVLFCLMIYLKKRGLTRGYRNITQEVLFGGIMALSLAGILALTLCGREWDSRMGSRFSFIPFWSYWRTFTQGDEGLGIQIVNNILLFIPFGLALPLNFPQFGRLRRIILAAALLSLAVELIQGFTGLGLCEIDDVMGNTLGAGIGGELWYYGVKLNKNRRQQTGNF